MPNGYVISEVVLASKRQALQVVDRDDVGLGDVGQAFSVERDPFLDVTDQSSQPLGLKRAEVLARHRFQLRLEDHQRILCLSATQMGWMWRESVKGGRGRGEVEKKGEFQPISPVPKKDRRAPAESSARRSACRA
jgi:hypothetical protein